jgi:hypothetical protein
VKKILFILSVSLLLSNIAFLITCKNSPVRPIDEPVLYGTIWARGNAATAKVLADLNYPDQCPDNSFAVNGKRLEVGYNHFEYYAGFGGDDTELPETFTLEADYCGKTVTATTRLCDTFSIITPLDDSTFASGQPLEVIWTSGGDGFKYAVMVEWLYPEFVVPVLLTGPQTDTCFTIPNQQASNRTLIIKVFCYTTGLMYGDRIIRQDTNNLSGDMQGFFGSVRFQTARVYPEH